MKTKRTSASKRGSSGANGHVIFVRVTHGEHVAVVRRAAEERVAAAEWCRRAIRAALGNGRPMTSAERLSAMAQAGLGITDALEAAVETSRGEYLGQPRSRRLGPPRSTDPDVEAI